MRNKSGEEIRTPSTRPRPRLSTLWPWFDHHSLLVRVLSDQWGFALKWVPYNVCRLWGGRCQIEFLLISFSFTYNGFPIMCAACGVDSVKLYSYSFHFRSPWNGFPTMCVAFGVESVKLYFFLISFPFRQKEKRETNLVKLYKDIIIIFSSTTLPLWFSVMMAWLL